MTVLADPKYAPLLALLTDADVAAIRAVRFVPHGYETALAAPSSTGGVVTVRDQYPRAEVARGGGDTAHCCFFGVPMGDFDHDEHEGAPGTPSADDLYGWLASQRGAPEIYLPEGRALDDLMCELVDNFDEFYRDHPGEDVNAWVAALLALREG